MSALQIKKEDFRLFNENYVSAEGEFGNWSIVIGWFKSSTLIYIVNDFIDFNTEIALSQGTSIEEAIESINKYFVMVYNEIIV